MAENTPEAHKSKPPASQVVVDSRSLPRALDRGTAMKASANVLLVDDERELVAILAQRLVRRNFAVAAAHSGEDALAHLEAHKDIEVVVLDVKMPGMDGIDTLERIKKDRPLIEVVMLTGHATIESAIEAITLGASDYLLKPVDIEQLVSKIERAAARRRQRDQAILDVHMTPYLTRQEREERIARIMEPPAETKRAEE